MTNRLLDYLQEQTVAIEFTGQALDHIQRFTALDLDRWLDTPALYNPEKITYRELLQAREYGRIVATFQPYPGIQIIDQ